MRPPYITNMVFHVEKSLCSKLMWIILGMDPRNVLRKSRKNAQIQEGKQKNTNGRRGLNQTREGFGGFVKTKRNVLEEGQTRNLYGLKKLKISNGELTQITEVCIEGPPV